MRTDIELVDVEGDAYSEALDDEELRYWDSDDKREHARKVARRALYDLGAADARAWVRCSDAMPPVNELVLFAHAGGVTAGWRVTPR